ILDLSKVEAGKMRLRVEDFSADLVVNDIAATIRPLLRQNSNSLNLQIESPLGEMHSDLTRLRQVLLNLLSNAAKFTHDGTVTFSVRRQSASNGDEIVFVVSDTGIGMQPGTIENLFEAFSQPDPATANKYGGSGLGLAISRQICRLMGGDIEV